jgi:hypothetical protein
VVGLYRNEVGSLIVTTGLGAVAEHALISLPAINGLRISDALGAGIDNLGLERGHCTLTVLREGGKIVTIPLTARAIGRSVRLLRTIAAPDLLRPRAANLEEDAIGDRGIGIVGHCRERDGTEGTAQANGPIGI